MNNNESKKLDAAAKRYIWLGLIAILLNLSLTTLGLVYPFAGSWSLIWVISPILVLILYGLIGFRLSGGNSQLLYRYSESSYFLGYFTTIISLIAVTLDISKDPNPLGNLGLILHKGAGAIFATVAGLGMMFWLRIHAQSREISENYTAASAPMAVVSGSSLTPETIALIEKYNSKLSATLEEFLKTIEEYNSRFKITFDKFLSPIETIGSKLPEFKNLLDQVNTNINNLNTSLVSTTKNYSDSTNAYGELKVVISNFVTEFSNQLAKLNDLTTNLSNLGVQITNFQQHMNTLIKISENISNLTKSISDLQTSFSNLNTDVHGVGKNMSDVKNVITDFVETSRNILTHMGNDIS